MLSLITVKEPRGRIFQHDNDPETHQIPPIGSLGEKEINFSGRSSYLTLIPYESYEKN